MEDLKLSKVTMEIFNKLEQKWLHHCDGKKTRILSIDGCSAAGGGGAAATAAAYSIILVEDQIRAKTGDSQSRIADYFDIIAGTGVGAIYAAMLAAADGYGRPLYSARDAVKFVTERSSEMFKIKTAGILRRRKRFSGKSADKVMKEAFRREDGKVITLKDTCKPLLVPCFDLNSSAPFVFSRADASQSPSYDFELWKVCRATSANPSMFKPFDLTSVDGKTSCSAVDGGLVMNNPAAAAVTHVLHNKRDFPSVTGVEDLLLLSLENNGASANSKLRHNGECSAPSIVGIALDGVSETVDQMLGNAFCWNRNDYVRIQGSGYVSGGGGVAAKEEEVMETRGVESLPFGGKRLLTETNGERIAGFVQRLVATGRSSLPPSPCKDAAVSPLANGRQ